MSAPLRNHKHEHFAQLVAKGEKPPRAYVAAGYSEAGAAQSAGRLLKDAQVCARIEQLRKAVEEPARERAIEKAAVNKAWVLHNLTKIVSMGMQAEPVTDEEGQPVGEYRQNLAAANKALELVGKELGMFVERKEIRTGALDDLDHEELKRLRDALGSVLGTAGTSAGGAGGAPH